MSIRKQQLLKRHRRNKRISMLVILALAISLSVMISLWLLPLILLLVWLAHEAWFSDHQFYSSQEDYLYQFPEHIQPVALQLTDGRWRLEHNNVAVNLAQSTLIAQIKIRSTWLGRWFDPVVCIGNDRQTFERCARGLRYLNLTGQGELLLTSGLTINSRFCRVEPAAQLFIFGQPTPIGERIMVLAPHADDAELAAFGLYSSADTVSIVTLTQGEIDAQHYQRLGLNRQEAAQLKGRLRTWDSLSIPLWGGVAEQHCVQLGYYCMQLPAMAQQPEQLFGSKESGENDIRTARQHNAIALLA